MICFDIKIFTLQLTAVQNRSQVCLVKKNRIICPQHSTKFELFGLHYWATNNQFRITITKHYVEEKILENERRNCVGRLIFNLQQNK